MEEKKVQLIRVVGDLLKTDITDEELKFRKSEYSNEKKILKKSLICTACGKDVKNRIISNYKINVHPVLEKCEEFYDDGNFSTDEDGSDKYCRWCAQGGDLYCCSYCSVAFCAVCVKRNLPKKIFKELDDDDWRCFVCITNPLWSLRALCDAAKKYVDSHTKCARKSRRKRSEDEDESEEEDENSETEATPRKSRRSTGKDLEMLVDSDDGVFKKQVDSHKRNARKPRRKKSENESEEEEEKEEESSEIETAPLKSKRSTGKDLEMLVDSDNGVFKKQVDSHKKNVRKSRRKKSEDEDGSEEEEKKEEENSETETTPRKSRRSPRKNLKVVVDSDDDDVSKEMKKSKRKHGSSNEESSVRNKRRKKNEDDEEEEVEKLEDPNEEKKQLLENLIIDTLNDCGALRKVMSMKENSFKKLFLNTKSSEVNENIKLAEEKFSKLFFDSIESIKVIKKKFLNGTEILQKNAENSELTKPGENVSIINGNENESESASIHEHDDVNTSTRGANSHEDESTEVVQDDDVTVENNLDVDITIANKVNDDSIEDNRVDDTSLEKSINENSIENNSDASVAENNNDSSIEKSNKDESAVESDVDAQKNDSIKDDDEEVTETSCANDMNGNTSPDDYCLTIAEDHIEKDDSHSINDSLAVNASSTIDSIKTDDFLSQSLNSSQANKTLDQTSNNDGIQENGNVVDENDEDEFIERPNKIDKEKVAKLALLQSSSDNETVQQKSSESDLSGVSVLNSDTEETKMKKKKTRKELNKLRGSVKNDSDDDDDHLDKIVNRLTDLGSLKNKKQIIEEDEDETEKESGEENDVKNSSKKKTLKKNNKNTSLMKYFSDGDKSDASDISFSKLNSFIENKNKAYLDGKEELSKKMLLDFSSEEENEEKCDEQKLKKESNVDAKKSKKKESEIIDLDSDGEKNQRKSKPSWKTDPLLTEKLSKTDTSDDESGSVRDGKKKQKQRKGWDSKSNSDSEDLFLPKKKEVAKKKRKTRISSSDTDFDAKDDNKSTEVSSEEEVPKNKKRKRIKNFNDSNSSDDEVAEMNQSQGSASKGRKNIRKMLHEEDLAEITRKTAKEEEERKKRISERQALFNESFNLNIQQNQFLTKLVLDFDPKTKEELIVVHPSLIIKLKPHQAKGVKFMWDSCFESLEMTKTSPGNGCILAHCMGLGKTLQVIALIHTVMRYSELNVKRVLIICPLSTVLNWVAEFDQWLRDVEFGDDIDVYYLVKSQNNVARADYLNNWFRKGGVMVLGYEMFRNLINTTKVKNRIKQYFIESLLDPGPDLVVCDEGHMLKNESSALSQAAMKIKTRRRIVLTGTPLQNNLKEYHCMVQFVKPNLLGDRKEFLNRFANPITNGQYSNSTSHDVRVMKRRAHVLHKMLDGTVQRFDYNVLTPFLPAKHEFVILVGLSDLQATLYQHYIDNFSKKVKPAETSLFKDYQIMRLIWTHPYAMKLSDDRKKKMDDKKFETDSEGSLKDFVVHTDESSSSDSDGECSDKSDKSVISITSEKSVKNRLTRAKKKELGIADEELEKDVNLVDFKEAWWRQFVSDEQMEDFKMGPKIVLLFAILRQCEEIGDKVLVFSQSIPSLDMIEYFLQKWESSEETKNDRDYLGTWDKGVDYFRLDGQTPSDLRSAYCNKFNRTNNLRSRLFLISTKAGGLGINLTAANRVIIFDASWNPSYDVQSIFRIYRFGQTKPCYIYRFLSQGTMEEKIYERQVTKLSISCRVVDEQQIDRHFNNTDIVALYEFNRLTPSLDVPKLPKDRLMAELLKEYKQYIVKYHEHDSLLENVVEEELTEEERKQAWEDYENEKKGVVNASVNMSSQLLINAQAEAMFDRNVILNALRVQYPTVVGPQLQIMYNMVCNELRQKYVQQIQMQMAATQRQNDKVNSPVADVQKQSLVTSGEPVSDPHLRKALETLPTNVEQIAIRNGSTSQE